MANEHDGHRERVRKKFLLNGLDVFEPHEALEMYLFYAVPRKDTNALAHKMLDRYLTIGQVCDSPVDELQNDFGLSESAAVLLKLLPEMARLYTESKLMNSAEIEPDEIGDIFKAKFIGRTKEAVALILGNARGKMIFSDIITKGSIGSTDVPIRKIADLSLRHNAKVAFIAHNHPSGSLLPSRADIKVTRTVYDTLESLGIRLIDHYIVTDTDAFSLRESGICDDIFFC
ncbi:MAG: hypothetical protein IIZ36_04045 [Ruminococcus sp.]|nr:hypothetical protein [Ruminococcus sp.]